jgi:hypothetical protein
MRARLFFIKLASIWCMCMLMRVFYSDTYQTARGADTLIIYIQREKVILTYDLILIERCVKSSRTHTHSKPTSKGELITIKLSYQLSFY